MTIHKELELVATGGVDGKIILYDAKTNKVLATFETHT